MLVDEPQRLVAVASVQGVDEVAVQMVALRDVLAQGLVAGRQHGHRITDTASQFSLVKSFPGFAPIGPWLVTPDKFDDPDDLELRCAINGEEVQKGRTRDLIHSVPASRARPPSLAPMPSPHCTHRCHDAPAEQRDGGAFMAHPVPRRSGGMRYAIAVSGRDA